MKPTRQKNFTLNCLIAAIALMGATCAFTANAQTNFVRLASLGSTGPGITTPFIQGSDGVLYGVSMSYKAVQPGETNNNGYGYGFAFKIKRDGSGYTVLHTFSGADGAYPMGVLENTNDGVLYGVTRGTGNGTYSTSAGTLFRLNKDGSQFSVISGFFGTDNPNGLIQASDGYFYGTSHFGGSADAGTIFKAGTNGLLQRLHSFYVNETNGGYLQGDGVRPQAGLVEGGDGALYGTTQRGGLGVTGGDPDYGTVFKINKDGSGYQKIHDFLGGTADGRDPWAPVTWGSDNMVYGTTVLGGSNGVGVVFQVSPDGSSYSILHHFTPTEGNSLYVTICEGPDHALYGVNYGDMTNSLGTIYRMEKTGSNYTVLHSFSGPDGIAPVPGLFLSPDGNFYGATTSGGTSNYGTFYKLFSATPLISFSGVQSGLSGVTLNLSGGAAGQNLNIQATADPSNTNGWQVIGSATAAVDGTFQFTDTNAPNFSERFYRGVSQ